MKKTYLLIVVGVLFVSIGLYLYFGKDNNQLESPSEDLLSKEEATSILSQSVKDIIKVYESPSTFFDVSLEEIDGKKMYKVNNYSEVIKTIFTEKGITQFESINFENSKFVTINEDNSIYFLGEIPSDNKYSNSKIVLNKVNVKLEELSCEVTFSDAVMDEEGIMNYYVIVKEFKLVKVDDRWLIDDFVYSNE